MAITGTQISTRVGILLNDTDSVRWDWTERLAWINDGRREMAIPKPEIFGAAANEITHTLTTGCKQRIATTDAYKIASVDYNVTSGAAIRPTTQEQLDTFKPTWRNDAAAADVQNWFSDQTDPLSFWVYPASTGDIKAHVHISPPDLASLDDVALPFDIYEPVLVNYVCYRALAKEDEAGAAAKAQAFYTLFTSALA